MFIYDWRGYVTNESMQVSVKFGVRHSWTNTKNHNFVKWPIEISILKEILLLFVVKWCKAKIRLERCFRIMKFFKRRVIEKNREKHFARQEILIQNSKCEKSSQKIKYSIRFFANFHQFILPLAAKFKQWQWLKKKSHRTLYENMQPNTNCFDCFYYNNRKEFSNQIISFASEKKKKKCAKNLVSCDWSDFQIKIGV